MKKIILLLTMGYSIIVQLMGCKTSAHEQPGNTEIPVNRQILFVGTYTSGNGTSKSEGIYVYRVDFDSMKFTLLHTINTSNPSYLCISQDKKFLYSVNENNPGQLSAFSIDSTYALSYINAVPSEGSYPCYVAIDLTGKFILTANYGSGNFAMFRINSDGSLTKALSAIQDKGKGPNTSRQEGPHAHMIFPNEHNGKIYATDLGTDEVHVFTIDTVERKLIQAVESYRTKTGSGPRHLAVHPNGRWMYILTELKGSIEATTIDPTSGSLTNFQIISTVDSGENRYPGSADIHITSDGKYLYATNRGEINNIACFSIDARTGKLSLLGHVESGGRTPRNFIIDPSGKYLLVAHQDSNSIVIFSIENNGLLKKLSTLNIPMPVCLKFL